MTRIGVTVTEEMHAALKAEQDRTGVSISEIVRRAVEKHFEEQGIQVDTKVDRGGYRGRGKEDEKN